MKIAGSPMQAWFSLAYIKPLNKCFIMTHSTTRHAWCQMAESLCLQVAVTECHVFVTPNESICLGTWCPWV